jgi:VanZ family protein
VSPDTAAGRPRHSNANALAAAWALLIVYASLHPFSDWLSPAQADARLLWLPWPRYWIPVDIAFNLLGYLPFGFLLAAGALRLRRGRWTALLRGAVLGTVLSLLMEWLQILLPMRVPSRADWLLNAAGALIGAGAAVAAAALGWFERWQRLRERLFSVQAGAGVALLLLWPAALLVPPPLPLGLGQVQVPLREALEAALEGTTMANWFALPAPNNVPLAPGVEMIATALGFLLPCFVAFSVTSRGARRLPLAAGAMALGLGAMALSTVLNFGPVHAAAWISPPVLPALLVAGVLALAMLWWGERWVAGVGLVGITLHVMLVNHAVIDPYFAANLQQWEQGRFIRFHGVTQWLAWIWPFAALAFLLRRVAGRDAP